MAAADFWALSFALLWLWAGHNVNSALREMNEFMADRQPVPRGFVLWCLYVFHLLLWPFVLPLGSLLPSPPEAGGGGGEEESDGGEKENG